MKKSVATFQAAKGAKKISMLTAYDYTIASLVDSCGIDAILVGDSLGMVMLGYENTLKVTLDDMIRHCASVARGAKNALIVCDMPFMSSQCGIEDTLKNAGRLIKEGGAEAIKLEGGAEFSGEIAALVRASIPVMAHIGLMPQSVNAIGGYRVQGRDESAAQKLVDDALAVQEAGAFAVLLECVPASLAARVTSMLTVPTIGIGAGPGCDGQILVWQDMAGLNTGHTPKFVRKFADAGDVLRGAFSTYAAAVQSGEFPAAEHCYGPVSENNRD